jgi:hypothetical protein
LRGRGGGKADAEGRLLLDSQGANAVNAHCEYYFLGQIAQIPPLFELIAKLPLSRLKYFKFFAFFSASTVASKIWRSEIYRDMHMLQFESKIMVFALKLVKLYGKIAKP